MAVIVDELKQFVDGFFLRDVLLTSSMRHPASLGSQF